MSNRKHSRLKAFLGFTTSLIFFIVACWIIFSRQFIIDQFNVWQYKPSSDIAAIAQSSTMTDSGRFYFYASDPAIETATDFNANCQRLEPQNAILGCYSNMKIYVYNVDNSQLDGIEEVTAAHETLHAIWDRMSDSERQSIGELLDKEYSKINDQSLGDRMNYYGRNEPGERLNELHSILGTEYANLDSELEAHYNKYFSNRSKLVAYHTNYQTVFNNLKVQSEALLKVVQSMKADLDARTAKYNSDAASLQSDYDSFSARSDEVDLTSSSEVDQYNAELADLRVRANQLEKERNTIISLQTEYNSKVTEYNKLVVASNNLIKSVDSTLESSPSL